MSATIFLATLKVEGVRERWEREGGRRERERERERERDYRA